MKIKKLKLYGEKDDFKGFIAEIYMNGKELIVESKDEQLKNDLLTEINKHIENAEFFYLPELINDKELGLENAHGVSKHKPCDPKFLDALQCEFWNYTVEMNKFGHKKFGGYKIKGNKSEIMEE